MKTSIILPLLALSVRVFAVPPACLLNAVNTQDEPSDLGAICGKDAEDVQGAIASLCGDNQSVAQSAFIATCSSAGSSVAPYTATTHRPSQTGVFIYTTAVYNSDCDCTTTIVTSATGADASNFATATGDSSASATGASQTGNIAADIKGMGSFAAAVVAVAGAIAAL